MGRAGPPAPARASRHVDDRARGHRHARDAELPPVALAAQRGPGTGQVPGRSSDCASATRRSSRGSSGTRPTTMRRRPSARREPELRRLLLLRRDRDLDVSRREELEQRASPTSRNAGFQREARRSPSVELPRSCGAGSWIGPAEA
jgi:hypothetical protein